MGTTRIRACGWSPTWEPSRSSWIGKTPPRSVDNFLRYVDDGFYNGTLFHRVVRREPPSIIAVIQGGGYDQELEAKETRSPIRNESDNGLKNDQGTIAMARQTALDSATSQFFINVEDNDSLNATPGTNDGYAVFGRVTDGMNVVERIGELETETRDEMSDIPVANVLLHRVDRISRGSDSDGTITDRD